MDCSRSPSEHLRLGPHGKGHGRGFDDTPISADRGESDIPVRHPEKVRAQVCRQHHHMPFGIGPFIFDDDIPSLAQGIRHAPLGWLEHTHGLVPSIAGTCAAASSCRRRSVGIYQNPPLLKGAAQHPQAWLAQISGPIHPLGCTFYLRTTRSHGRAALSPYAKMPRGFIHKYITFIYLQSFSSNSNRHVEIRIMPSK